MIAAMKEVFVECDSNWRGIGNIPTSGLCISDKYDEFNAHKKFNIRIESCAEPKGCRCGEVLTGTISPRECPLFGKTCTPTDPVGACMVSSEGSCAACFKYAGY